MKTKIFFILICNLLICNLLISQNITNTLGTLGVFKIKDGSTDYLTLDQSTGQVNILKTLRLENTTSATTGVIFKGGNRFIHDYGASNTFMGINSGNFTMSGHSNIAVGIRSLFSNTTGTYNTAFGLQSLYSNTSGYNNIAVGYYSLSGNTTGNSNTAVGQFSLTANTTGIENTAVGSLSLYTNTSGYDNTAVGYSSLISNTTGHSNSALGYYSLYSNTTGYRNTVLGYLSGYWITTGFNNIAIGYSAQVPSGTSNNQVRIGDGSITYAGIQVGWTITSDRRWKSNISNSNLGLNFINKLRPVSYFRTNDENKKTEYGFIAQEVEEILKESGVDNSGMLTITDDGMYELRYNDLLAPMVKAIQELKEENDRLKTEIETLKTDSKKTAELETMFLQLKEKIEQLETETQNVKVSNK